MTCIEVRDRLTEHALGVLSLTDAREVERHLERCAGCRKESSELTEGAATVALSLPSVAPPPALKDQIVDRFRATTRQSHQHVRGRLRVLAAATLAAALLALGSMGWAIAERNHAQTLKSMVAAKNAQVRHLADAIASFQGQGKTLQATLLPPPGLRGGGSAVIFTAPRVNDLIFVDVVLGDGATGPYVIQLVDGHRAIIVGKLQRTVEGDWLLPNPFSAQDLSGVVSVTILKSGRVVLTGTVRPYAGR